MTMETVRMNYNYMQLSEHKIKVTNDTSCMVAYSSYKMLHISCYSYW